MFFVGDKPRIVKLCDCNTVAAALRATEDCIKLFGLKIKVPIIEERVQSICLTFSQVARAKGPMQIQRGVVKLFDFS